MPFTLSHPAAVLPFVRSPLSAAGLVAGAVAADLPYFVRAVGVPVTAQSWYEPYLNATTSHTLTGSLTVALPYAVLLVAVWHAARRPAASLLVTGPTTTAGLRAEVARAVAARDFAVRGGWMLLSLLIGIGTHLLWDSFTHGDGLVVTHVAVLSEQAVAGLTWARLLQHVSTVAGLLILAWYLWRRRSSLRVRRAALVSALVVAVAGAVAGVLAQWPRTRAEAAEITTEHLLRSGAETAGLALLASALCYVVTWWTVHILRQD